MKRIQTHIQVLDYKKKPETHIFFFGLIVIYNNERHLPYNYFDGSGMSKIMVPYGMQYPEVGYWILRWDTRTLNPGVPGCGKIFQTLQMR
jgi:hypothetical protein